jgi:proteasome lid subunit RPN8/RPN11
MSDLPEDVLRAAIAHCEAAYPNEGCGLLLQTAGGVVAKLMKNAMDRYHQRDPVRFPRTSATAYLFDPREQMETFESADRSGDRIFCIFHSHPDRGAYFSEEDQRSALVDGKPLLPGVEYLVISVRSGRTDELKLFAWTGSGWSERSIPLPTRP